MKPWKAIALADLHCGCPRWNPDHFERCVDKFIIPQITDEITYVFICGDFFDTSIVMSSAASYAAVSVISKLKRACHVHHCKLRVLRGTFTHDRDQTKHFLTVSPEYNDWVKVADTLSIEIDPETETSILYMPDNLRHKDIYASLDELYANHHLEKVDVVVRHGYFHHLIDPRLPPPPGSLAYEDFCKYYSGIVLNGHVHFSSVYKNIISIGSFGRLTHGDEGPKGFYIVDRTEDGRYIGKFVENSDAVKFYTIDLQKYGHDKDIADAIEYIKNERKDKIDNGGELVHVRLIAEDRTLVDSLTDTITEMFNNVRVDRYNVAKREQVIENVSTDLSKLEVITPDNLESLLMPLVTQADASVTKDDVHNILESCKATK